MSSVSVKRHPIVTLAKCSVCLYVSVLCLFLARTSYAQEEYQAAIKLGEVDLFPSIRVNYDSIDNIYRVRQNDMLEATGMRIEPEAVFIADKRGVEVKFGYDGSYASYSEDELNFDDHHLFGSADLRLGTKKRLVGDAYFRAAHQDFGTGLSRNVSNVGLEQVELSEFGLNAGFTYGAPSARYNLGLGVSLVNIGYENREVLTNGRDYLEISPFSRLSYRISADTRAILEFRVRSLNYDNNQLDKNELSVVTGLSFSGTGKTGGEAKIGAAASRYSEALDADNTILVADIGLYFIPSSLSRIDLGLRRQFNDDEAAEFAGDTSQSVDDLVSLKWRARWSGFISSTAFLEYQNKNRDCPDVQTSLVEAGVEVSVRPRRWVELGVNASNINQAAESCGGLVSSNSEYEVQLVSLFLKVSL